MSELTVNRVDRRTIPDRRRCTERFTATEASMLVLLVCALLAAALLSGSPERAGLMTTSVDVETGDTLWGMAQEYPVTGLSTEQTVELIAELNNLKTPGLVAGRSLQVPLQGAPAGVAMR